MIHADLNGEEPSVGEKRKASLRPEDVMQEFQEKMHRALKLRDKKWHEKIAEWKRDHEKQKKKREALLKETKMLRKELKVSEKEKEELRHENDAIRNANRALMEEIECLRKNL